MANLYGIASPNPVPVGVNTIGGVDVACPAGSETNVLAILFNPPTVNGVYYPFIGGYLVISLGATPPTALQYNVRLGAGSDFIALAIGATLLVANANIIQPIYAPGTALIMNNPSGANTFNVSLTPTAQAVTVRTNGTIGFGQWVRATDQ